MRIHEHFSLLNYNTFKIDVLCNQFVEIENDSEMDILFEKNFFDDNYLIIGGGSNILFTRPFEGTVVKMITKGIELVDASDDCVVLDVSAGVEWADFVDYCNNVLKMRNSDNYFQSGILVFDIDKCLKFNLLDK